MIQSVRVCHILVNDKDLSNPTSYRLTVNSSPKHHPQPASTLRAQSLAGCPSTLTKVAPCLCVMPSLSSVDSQSFSKLWRYSPAKGPA
jgi:hypothetical protein